MLVVSNIRALLADFPMQKNREFARSYQGKVFAKQGICLVSGEKRAYLYLHAEFAADGICSGAGDVKHSANVGAIASRTGVIESVVADVHPGRWIVRPKALRAPVRTFSGRSLANVIVVLP